MVISDKIDNQNFDEEDLIVAKWRIRGTNLATRLRWGGEIRERDEKLARSPGINLYKLYLAQRTYLGGEEYLRNSIDESPSS